MKLKSLMTAICVLATANFVSAAPFAYVANSGTKDVSIIDTATNTVTDTVALPGTNPYAYGVAVGASGQYVYVGLQTTNKVAVIDAATKAVVKLIDLGTDSPGGLAVNAAETRLYVASNLSNTLIVIDITGAGASEVGRVTVDDSALSNPEGVVINSAGTKAYVANSTKGTVAEISLDEANNLYLRTNLISLGANLQPYGLTINSTGTKLYAAGLNGNASMIDTASRAVTNLVVGGGTVSVAITPDNSKIYAPSNQLDKIYVIDGVANTVSGTNYSAITGPFGSSVTPDGSKLLLTMNTTTGGNTVQVFNTSNLLTAPAVITVGTLPTSMGDFIGPAFPFTITSAAQTGCTISPLGAVPVNDKGRTFSVSASSGTCEIYTGTTTCTPLAGGASQGLGANYTFSNVAANNTICAVNRTGTYFTLSGDWISSVGGWLKSAPVGIDAGSKSAQFLSGDPVTLSVGDAANHQVQAGSWTGDCAGSGSTCTLTMTANKTFGATIINKPPPGPGGPIYNVTKGTYHTTLAEATGAASTNDVIKISTDYTTGGTTTGTAGVTVKMSSQWKASDYSQQDTVYKSTGTITIKNVAITVDTTVGNFLKI